MKTLYELCIDVVFRERLYSEVELPQTIQTDILRKKMIHDLLQHINRIKNSTPGGEKLRHIIGLFKYMNNMKGYINSSMSFFKPFIENKRRNLLETVDRFDVYRGTKELRQFKKTLGAMDFS